MDAALPISVTTAQAQETRELYSPDYLLLLPLRGSVFLKGIEETQVHTGTLIFLAPFSGRKLCLNAGCSVIYAAISANYLESMIGISKLSPFLLLKDDNFRATERLVNYFDLCSNDPEATYLQKMGACFDLLRALEKEITALPIKTDSEPRRGSQFAAYLEAHFREPLQLSDLAEAFGVTRQHISTMLHKELGVPFSAYLLRLRLNEALRLLLTTDKNITTISEESGFPNLRAFNVAFRNQQGCSPKEYRQKKRLELQTNEPQSDSLHSVNQLLQPYRMVYQRSEEAVSVSDEVKVGGGTLYQPIWQDTINVDNSADLLQSMAQEQLAAIQKELSFRYVRLSNILCHELTPYMAALKQHRFTYYFRVIDFVKSIGLTPTLTFGDSYTVLLDSVMLNDGSYSVAMEDWLRDFSSVLDASITHWGKSWVSSWRFEFRMPDRLYGTVDHQGFMDLYERSVRILKEKLPTAEVGGPAIPLDAAHMDRWNVWFQELSRREAPVDFISIELWADYTMETTGFPGQYGEWKEVRSMGTLINADAGLAVQKIKHLRAFMEAHHIAAKLYVSTLGITKYQAMAAQIGGHGGAYLVKCCLELGKLVDGIGCWKAINQEAEYPSEYSIFGNGCGLMSRYGLKNPNWYAHQFLSKLYPRLLFQGMTSFITTDGGDHFAILIHNCKNYSDYFRKNYLTFKGYSFQESGLYTSHSALKQSLRLTGVAPQTYMVKQYLIGDHHGNIAAVLKEMGFLRSLNQSEITYVAGQSLPYQHAFQVEVADCLSLTVTLQPNEVMLLLVSPEEIP